MITLARALLTALLLLAAFSKLVQPDPDAILSAALQRGVGLLEVLGAVALWTARAKVAAAGVLAFSLAGAGVILSWGTGVKCGCLGSVVQLSRLQHLGFASALASLACLLIANAGSTASRRTGSWKKTGQPG